MLGDSTCAFKLQRGGGIKIHSNMINPFDQIEVEEELMKHPKLFREYPIQGGREPRANLFFHEKAIDGESAQPGYKYRSTRMKAISYEGFKSLERVSKHTAEVCSVPYWNIGVNVVYYRDGNDSIGYHSDNDQGEDKILSKFSCTPLLFLFTGVVVTLIEQIMHSHSRLHAACLISSPPTPRVVRIRVERKGKYLPAIGDEDIMLRLQAGDAYEMDGT
jgi:hypothetical protein